MYLSRNCLFNVNTPNPRLNKKNFAINSRIYDTTATGTLYSQTIARNPTPAVDNVISRMNDINFQNVNPDTAMGQSWFHENRYRGTAAYVYSF